MVRRLRPSFPNCASLAPRSDRSRRGDMLANDEASIFSATVVNRLKAEEQVSHSTRCVACSRTCTWYAGLGAATAAAVCVVIMLSMMRFATNERPDSLAAIMNLLASRLSSRCRLPAS